MLQNGVTTDGRGQAMEDTVKSGPFPSVPRQVVGECEADEGYDQICLCRSLTRSGNRCRKQAGTRTGIVTLLVKHFLQVLNLQISSRAHNTISEMCTATRGGTNKTQNSVL